METVMGEVEDLSKEENSSSDYAKDAVHINGEVNGIAAMEVCSVRSSEVLIGSKKCSSISDECVDDCGSLLSSTDHKSCTEKINNREVPDASVDSSDLGHEVPADSEMEVDNISPRASIEMSDTENVDDNAVHLNARKEQISISTREVNFESMDCDSVSSTAKDEYCSDINSECETTENYDSRIKDSDEEHKSGTTIASATDVLNKRNAVSECFVMETVENEETVRKVPDEDKSFDNEADGPTFEEEKLDNSCDSVSYLDQVVNEDVLANEECSTKLDQALVEGTLSQDNSSVISDADTEDTATVVCVEDPLSLDKEPSADKDTESEKFHQSCIGEIEFDIGGKPDCDMDDSSVISSDSLSKPDNKVTSDNSNADINQTSSRNSMENGENISREDEINTSGGSVVSVEENENTAIEDSESQLAQAESDSIQSLERSIDGEEMDSKSEGDTPGKIKKNRKSIVTNTTPRRSSRNLNKQKSYIEKEEDPDIQEIAPVDPLADTDPLRDDKENSKYRSSKKTTIVVNDTKRLAEIAAGTKHIKGKKEPTLVIIDTNSILAGKGPVPLSPEPSPLAGPSSTSSYSVLPLAVPAQGMYPRMSNPLIPAPATRPTPPPPTPPAPVLPTLTDDMFVVEAPSFIVPYVYEKPPIKPLKRFVEQLKKQLEEKSKESEQKRSELTNDKLEIPTEKRTVESVQNGEVLQNSCNVERDSKENVKEDNEITSENSEHTEKEKSDALKVCSNTEPGDQNNIEADKKEIRKEDDEKDKPLSHFEEPTGKFFMQIGFSLVQEYVQTDLLRSQKRKREREGGKPNSVTQYAINSLLKNLEFSKENNEPFHMELKKCEYCNFKTESSLVMAQHLETPHMRNYVYRCNFCPLEVRSPHDILFHMETEHNVRGRLERAPAFHQCPNCPFEDNQKGKLSRHLMSCTKKHKAERNQEPPLDWEPPAKIPKVSRSRTAPPLGLGAAAYQAIQGKSYAQHPLLPKLVSGTPLSPPVSGLTRGRGRPPLHSRYYQPQDLRPTPAPPPQPRQVAPTQLRQGMLFRQAVPPSQSQVLLPTAYQLSGSQLYQGTKYLLASSPLMVGNPSQMMPMMPGMPPVPRLTIMPPSSSGAATVPTPVALVPNMTGGNNSITIQSANSKNPAAKLLQQPSISITPLPRQATGVSHTQNSKHPGLPGHPGTPGSKPTFVICEICDGYIKDLEQLRNHMQWIHKVKIHPKMIYNRPPLNCQKCQFRFFTDQGLERHLLGSHGLVTSSMQENSNKGKDSGRCPICGRVYQWKLLNHVSRDHNMSLKPAHLSYKCTVCTATFGMYKQFENHVYSAHSVVAKSRVMDKKPNPPPRLQTSDTLLKPLKINDEITIIPQPARPRPGPASRTGAISAMMQQKQEKVYYCESCEATFDGSSGYAMYVGHVKRQHLRACNVKLCRLEECPTCRRSVSQDMLDYIEDNKNGVDVIELSDDELLIAGQGRNEITITKVPCAPGPKRFKHKLQQRSNVQVIELEDSPVKNKNCDENTIRENGEDSLHAVKERLRRRKSLEISQVDSESSSPVSGDDLPSKRRRVEDE